jgi:hypothetical protein
MAYSGSSHKGVGPVIDTLIFAERLLSGAGYFFMRADNQDRQLLLFEDRTLLGFAFAYMSTTELLTNWRADYDSTIKRLSFVFRRAGPKAWNCYAVFLASGVAGGKTSLFLHAIEEDLSGTRKIARGGIETFEDVRAALLPLLPIQNAPQLEAIDLEAETRQRAQDVPEAALKAFFDAQEPEEILALLSEVP